MTNKKKYNNNFHNVKKQLIIDDIISFQNRFHIILPDEIKEHYLRYNGGYPEKSAFYAQNGEIYAVNYFFSISCEGGLSLEKTLSLLSDEKVFPKWLIPLANDIGGNLFCYSLRNTDRGSIYYYNHEFNYGDNPEKYITFLSGSIRKFIDSLVEYNEE